MPWLNIIQQLFKPAADLVDNLTLSKEEKVKLGNELESIQNTFNKQVLDYESKITELQASIIEKETEGNWMQRSWRPLLMLAFGFIIIYEYFFSNILSLPKGNMPVEFWELLKLGLGGYVIGRSAEKIVPNLNFTKNKKS
ncbi:MAG: 3TM-type holin [Bacteroidales bacterium]